MSEEQEKHLREKEEKPDSELDIASIEIRSEEVQEIMGFIPHWIIRWGITLFFIVITVFVTGSYFFQYPDVIMSSIVVTTETPPAGIVARTSGKIQQLFVRDNQEVAAGERIALIETAVDYLHLSELKEKLDDLKSFSHHYDAAGPRRFEKNYALGGLQSIYSSFVESYQNYDYFIRLDFHNKKIESTRLQVARQKVLYEQTQKQNAIMERDFELSKETYESLKKLYDDKIISQSEFNAAKSAKLNKEYALAGARSSLSSQKIQVAQLEQTIRDLQQTYKEQKKRLELALDNAYNNLSGPIAQWEQTYLLKTPISGVVTFTKFWSANQNVNMGDTVVTVVPKEAGELVGKVVLPVQGSGKVKVGQRVNIKFHNYPHVEFGMVWGVIKARSLVASDNNYVLEVDLPEGLMTSYGEELSFNQEMQGTAEIITEDIRLLERIFKPIKSILERM
ncbi:MAG: HlyD family efflux transporter periplasmic adaptor subunit [bacterium]|nr:HlyD family efflux transporter periplasmic adaptor subunit [bacterium]